MSGCGLRIFDKERENVNVAGGVRLVGYRGGRGGWMRWGRRRDRGWMNVIREGGSVDVVGK
jgi:hypothetical protein